jgi:glyoxylase-like metal-dependent hydrolase (beta-lactamase superfamily II)
MLEKGFHYDIGEYRCIIFSDGTLVSQDLEKEEVFGINCLFINSGDYRILIDTGCGDVFQPTAGRLVKNLEAEGIKCLDIDRIIFTHGHIDHVGGSFDSQGRPVFPNARYIASEREWECWVTRPERSELQSMFFSPARKNLLPIRDQFDLVKDDAEVFPGIKLMAAPGHTPGNVVVDISSGEERLICIGDIIHSQIEFVNPEYLALFDVTPEQAINTRASILSDVAESGTIVFACHFPFPGLGYITQNEDVFAWQPI